MAIKELFYDQRPVALLNPRASQRIDPRFKFTRDSVGTYVDRDGLIKTQAVNAPRLEFDPVTGDARGLLVQPQTTNLFFWSEGFNAANWQKIRSTVTANATAAPDGAVTADVITPTSAPDGYARQYVSVTAGSTYTFSAFIKRQPSSIYSWLLLFAGIGAGSPGAFFNIQTGETSQSSNSPVSHSIEKFANGWLRCSVTVTVPSTASVPFVILPATTESGGAYTPDGTGIYVWGAQLEENSSVTSYIKTTTGQVTREADLLSVDSLSIPSTGSVYIDARAISAAETDTLISLKNASNEKINLSYESNAATYNSLALIASYKGTSKSSLPLPVPTTARERNIITWGANNYQYTTDSSRYATSLSSSVPANLTQLSIGHDAVDPTKAFNGYINAVYLYNGEITPAVAEALVRGELDPINADTYSPVGPTGSLALVINTQGATTGGDKTFTLPAESALNDNDIVITWGDGTESGLDGASAELGAPGLTHTYPAAGIYPVWVEGQLENLQFDNIANAPDLLQIAAWGTSAEGNDVFLSPSTMNSAFYGCSQMDFSTSARTTNLPDTSAVTSWYRAFSGCSSITGTFPAFNFSAATNFQEAWYGCSGLTSFTAAGDQTQNVTNFSYAWRDCTSLTSFPLINTAAGTDFSYTWYGCNSLTSFPLINTTAGTNFSSAWQNCSSLTSFPLINTSSATSLQAAWRNCSSMTVFPLLTTNSCINFREAWFACSGLTVFPFLNTGSGSDFRRTWYGCEGLTSFPLLDFSSATNLSQAWDGCINLETFPLIDTSSVTTVYAAWYRCGKIDNVANASEATSFPLINTSNCAEFTLAWRDGSALTVFPLLDTSSGTSFYEAWRSCASLTSFPSLNFDAAVGAPTDTAASGFHRAWYGCNSLADFPANRFNSTTCTRYFQAWVGCALTAQSIENILVSIEAAGTSNGDLGINGGTNAAKTTWSTAANNAYDALILRGWTITYNA